MLSSPTKNAVEARSVSPHKPHPLQFVSPQVAAKVAAPPPKPSRTFEFESNGPSEHQNKNESPSCKSVAQKKNMFDQEQVDSGAVTKYATKALQPKATAGGNAKGINSSAASQGKSDNWSDTPVRRSVTQKKSMFESITPEVDPAMMSMSDRYELSF